VKIRADIVELLRQGFNNTAIAAQTGVHRTTVARARHALNLPDGPLRPIQTPSERLYAEALPTGLVRDYGPTPRAERPPISPERAAANRAALAEAIRRPRRAA
jgi:hypothetical protein